MPDFKQPLQRYKQAERNLSDSLNRLQHEIETCNVKKNTFRHTRKNVGFKNEDGYELVSESPKSKRSPMKRKTSVVALSIQEVFTP